MESGTRDNFLLSDILFCHVMSNRPRIVIVVVKSVDIFLITAHLFECLTQEAARTLYSCYYTASNKYKLNRYRISKRRNEVNGVDDKSVLDRIHVSIRNVRRKSSSDSSRKSENGFDVKHLKESEMLLKGEHNKSFDELSAEKEENINVIEIKDSNARTSDSGGLAQRTDEHGVTRIEIGSNSPSLVSNFQDNFNDGSTAMYDCEQVLTALERLSIHSSNNPDSYLNHVGVTSSCPNSLIQTSREIHASREERKLRQRQPPLLIKKESSRKLDSLPRKEIRRRTERRNRSRSEERNRDENNRDELSQHETIDVASENHIKFQDPSDSLANKEKVGNNELKSNQTERQSRARNTGRENEDKRRLNSNHSKGPAPPPPPRRHPNDPSIMLVATKSGQENSRSYYPKESHIVRGAKLVRIDYPLYPPWNISSDINNNPKRVYYAHPGWITSHEYHSSRPSNSSTYSEMHKRSRSKSPARRNAANRYIDAVTTFNLSQKLKDLSDTVIQSLKNTAPGSNSPFDTRIAQDRVSGREQRKRSPPLSNLKYKSEDPLRPVIKRGKKMDNPSDSRRVTFSAYATVQVMD